MHSNKIGLKKEQILKLESLVQEAELKSTGEIVISISEESSPYSYKRLLLSIYFTFAISILIFILDYFYFWPLNLASFLFFQCVSWGIVFSLLKWNFFVSIFVSKKLQEEAVQKRAFTEFYDHKLFETKDRTGILLYVSKLEKCAVILGDKGINEKVPDRYWNESIQKLVNKIKQDQFYEGLCELTKDMGEKLSHHFPQNKDLMDVNELSNSIRIRSQHVFEKS